MTPRELAIAYGEKRCPIVQDEDGKEPLRIYARDEIRKALARAYAESRNELVATDEMVNIAWSEIDIHDPSTDQIKHAIQAVFDALKDPELKD